MKLKVDFIYRRRLKVKMMQSRWRRKCLKLVQTM
jgi:hypothetical protein